MSKAPPTAAEVAAQVREIYRELAQRPLARHCIGRTECCQFQLTGKTPFITRGEAVVAWQGLRASGRKNLPERPQGSCPMLKPDGKCMIYEHRPFGCRTHFCKAAGGPAPRELVRDLIQRLEQIDACLGGSGGVNLPAAMAHPPALK